MVALSTTTLRCEPGATSGDVVRCDSLASSNGGVVVDAEISCFGTSERSTSSPDASWTRPAPTARGAASTTIACWASGWADDAAAVAGAAGPAAATGLGAAVGVAVALGALVLVLASIQSIGFVGGTETEVFWPLFAAGVVLLAAAPAATILVRWRGWDARTALTSYATSVVVGAVVGALFGSLGFGLIVGFIIGVAVALR